MCCTWCFTPGPWRVFPFLRFHSQMPRTMRAARAATPLIVPPMMAPVFLEPLSLPSVSGASESPDSVDDGSAVSEAVVSVEVSDSVSEAVEVSDSVEEVSDVFVVDAVDSVVEPEEVSVDFVDALRVVDDFVAEVSVVVVLLLVPSVVGSDSELTGCVRGTFMLVRSIALFPEAVATTFVAKPDVEPHPN